MAELPKNYDHLSSEKKWQAFWDDKNIYAYDPRIGRDQTFSIDTPPPTVSGSLHIGHVFSYTQTDVVARYQRMKGKNVFYPMGWDDNGLPTERRVQNVFGITCDPSLPYDPTFKPTPAPSDLKRSEFKAISRKNFIEACSVLTTEDEKAFEAMWKHLGLSVDWSLQYATIDEHCRKMSQLSFLDLMRRGYVYQTVSPTMWDVDFQTAVAQAEAEDREKPGAYHDIRFGLEDGGEFVISTTRPELLAACIAIVAHPDDLRYKAYFGTYAISPLFHAKVPIIPADHADPEKGTGILMICTFGDSHDVEWWKQSDLPLRQVIGRDGCFIPVEWGKGPYISNNPEAAQTAYNQLIGLRAKQAQKKIVELLSQEGSAVSGKTPALKGDPKPIQHPVKFYEKGDSPLEFIPTRQWYIRILDYKPVLIEQGRKIEWHPSYMKTRYENWVDGLNQDWCISRQRYFGVSFPVWYPVKANGEPDYDAPIYPKTTALPVDPLTDVPEGFTEAQRGVPGGFVGDPDVMDTWATSSLTPQLMSHWQLDPKRHTGVFPFDIRPQSHEIIRTWAFYTIVKAWMHEHQIPWRHVAISGWVLDPDRKKMSKSKGNVVTPSHLLENYSSDAVRYWAAKARLGSDTAFDETVFGIGKRLSTKLFNASKFVLSQLEGHTNLTISECSLPMDLAQLDALREVTHAATQAFEALDYATALDKIETSFWTFCDHYIELVKTRAYRDENETHRRSALATLEYSLKTYLRLFAPFLPFITEEIWAWHFSDGNNSIHRAPWPSAIETKQVPKAPFENLLDMAVVIMSGVRGAKTQAQKNMKHPVSVLVLDCSEQTRCKLETILGDIRLAGSIETITFGNRDDHDVVVAGVTLGESNA